MSCEHLVCANCAGPVVEGRCGVCRASRQEVHHSGGPLASQLMIALALLLLLAATVLALRPGW
jgi:hypothetical protein